MYVSKQLSASGKKTLEHTNAKATQRNANGEEQKHRIANDSFANLGNPAESGGYDATDMGQEQGDTSQNRLFQFISPPFPG